MMGDQGSNPKASLGNTSEPHTFKTMVNLQMGKAHFDALALIAAESVAREARSLGVEALVAMGDVGKREDAMRIAEEALQSFGSVDVLVNNAAIREDKKFLEMSEEAWRYAMAVNFDSAYWLSRACLPGMAKKHWGRIINFAGMNALHGYTGYTHVSASKHAAWGLTKALAKEFGGAGITVNIVSPGPIQGEAHDPTMAAHIASMEARVPVGRLGRPDEVAVVVGLLASNAGAFVNGQMDSGQWGCLMG